MIKTPDIAETSCNMRVEKKSVVTIPRLTLLCKNLNGKS